MLCLNISLLGRGVVKFEDTDDRKTGKFSLTALRFMENSRLKDVLRIYTDLQQALHRGIIHSCLTDTFFFLQLNCAGESKPLKRQN